MRDKKVLNFLKDKGVIVALVLCLLSVAVITGVYSMQQRKNSEKNEIVDLSELQDSTEEELTEANNDKVTNTDRDLEDQFDEVAEGDAKDTEEDQTEPTASDQVEANVTKQIQMDFGEDKKLTWPVNGNVIMNFSMDQTIYYSTLEQYKYNPAIMISGDVNTKVISAANGKVTSVEINEETGNTLTLDLGNGYEAVYGQLKEVPLAEGDIVETNEVIGYISEPTKYYSVEGSNLYFKLLKDGEPVNPMNYLD